MLEARSPADAANIARGPIWTEPSDRAYALSQARSFGWTDIHPCFWDKLKSSFGMARGPQRGRPRSRTLRSIAEDQVLTVTFTPATAIDAQ
jgi:hypothetical protein